MRIICLSFESNYTHIPQVGWRALSDLHIAVGRKSEAPYDIFSGKLRKLLALAENFRITHFILQVGWRALSDLLIAVGRKSEAPYDIFSGKLRKLLALAENFRITHFILQVGWRAYRPTYRCRSYRRSTL